MMLFYMVGFAAARGLASEGYMAAAAMEAPANASDIAEEPARFVRELIRVRYARAA